MAHPQDSHRPPRDPAFKAMYSYPRMIADALRGYAAKPNGPLDPRTVGALDFRTLRKLPTEWVTDDFHRRIGDQAWQVRFRWARDWSDPRAYLLILVEFQSSVDRGMALRMASYALQLLAEMETVGMVRTGGPYPPIFPLLIHNGPRRWTAATALHDLTATLSPPAVAARPRDVEDARRAARDLAPFQLRHAHLALDFHRHREDDLRSGNAISLQIALESASTPEDLLPPLQVLRQFPVRRLAGTMLEWALRRVGVVGKKAEEMKRMASLDEFRSQLEETAHGWTEQWFAEGVEKGRAEGVEKGRAEGVEKGRAEGVEKGRAEGVEQGRAEGIAAQCRVLRRQTALRFGASAQRLDPLLDEVHSAAKLAEIGEWLMVDTIEQLIAKVEAAVADDGTP